MNKRRRFKAKARRTAFRLCRHSPTTGLTWSKWATARWMRTNAYRLALE